MTYDVITIGSTTYDFFCRAKLPVIDWPKTAVGSGLVLPLGEKIGVEETYAGPGGNAFNAARTFNRQGYKTAAVAKIGQDVLGEEIVRVLEKEKIDSRFIKKDSGLPTAYSMIFRHKGERAIVAYPGASHNLAVKDIDLEKLKSRWWYISLSGESYKILPRLLMFAAKNKILVALNPTGYHLKNGLKELRLAIKRVNLLLVNETEAGLIAGIPFSQEKKLFKKIEMMAPGIVAVTGGKKGAMVSDGRFVYQAGVFPSKVIDRTGAGDAFGSGLVAGLLRKNERCEKNQCQPEKIEYALRLASANAASVISQLGAGEGILSQHEFKTRRFNALAIKIKRIE